MSITLRLGDCVLLALVAGKRPRIGDVTSAGVSIAGRRHLGVIETQPGLVGNRALTPYNMDQTSAQNL